MPARDEMTRLPRARAFIHVREGRFRPLAREGEEETRLPRARAFIHVREGFRPVEGARAARSHRVSGEAGLDDSYGRTVEVREEAGEDGDVAPAFRRQWQRRSHMMATDVDRDSVWAPDPRQTLPPRPDRPIPLRNRRPSLSRSDQFGCEFDAAVSLSDRFDSASSSMAVRHWLDSIDSG